MEKPNQNEIVSLNVDSLDVEELERRLELAAGDASLAAWICGVEGNQCQPICSPVACNPVADISPDPA